MKKKFRRLVLAAFLISAPFSLIAQGPGPGPPPPPNGGNSPNGNTNTPVGGTAPVGEGLSILLALGAVYCIVKIGLIDSKPKVS